MMFITSFIPFHRQWRSMHGASTWQRLRRASFGAAAALGLWFAVGAPITLVLAAEIAQQGRGSTSGSGNAGAADPPASPSPSPSAPGARGAPQPAPGAGSPDVGRKGAIPDDVAPEYDAGCPYRGRRLELIV